MKAPTILDAYGRPIARAVMVQEVGGATLRGVRSPFTGYPADGLTPARLAEILREADMGDPLRFLELAGLMEERDPHYLGVLGARRRAVSQIEVTVDAGSDSHEHEAHAQMVRDWLQRDEMQDEIFNILDAIGKGYSLTEVTYDHSEGQYLPRLDHRDPRWFRFDRRDMVTPLLLGDDGQEIPLPPGKFIYARMPAKSGVPVRSGLARPISWAYLFKAYTQRDWAIFTQNYGQPMRIGRFGAGASEQDKATLYKAVSNIAGDMAGIIPDSMTIDFVAAANVSAANDLYRGRVEWIDQQVSKAVLGQTATTDAVIGGLGSGKEHGAVRADIKRADAKMLAAALNRDLVRVWVELEFGPQAVYPRMRIEDPEQEDLKLLADAIGPMLDRGLEVDQATIRQRLNLPEAKPGARLMRPVGAGAAAPNGKGPVALQSEGAALPNDAPVPDMLAAQMVSEIDPIMKLRMDKIEAMLAAAGSLGEFRAMVVKGFPDLSSDADKALSDVLATALQVAHLAGRADVEAESR